MSDAEPLEATLFICREVNVYKIPPRGPTGHRAGEWRTEDRIFSGRCRVVSKGESLEIRIEDPNSGELFAVCPVPRGQAGIVAEPASDSSRNFALRLEDASTGRHAFVGLNFAERSHAFDFNVALADHEKQLKRAEDIGRVASAADPRAAAAAVLPEAAALYQKVDLSLKPGQTIRIEVKKKEGAGAGPAWASAGAAAAGGRQLGSLAPPPAAARPAPSPAPPAPAPAVRQQLGGSGAAPPVQPPAAPAETGGALEGWATFD